MLNAAVRLGTTSAVAVTLLAFAPPAASGAARGCVAGAAAVGIKGAPGRRFDGVQARVAAVGRFTRISDAEDGISAVVGIGDPSRGYAGLMLTADRNGSRWRPAAAWSRRGAFRSRWLSRPDGWPAAAPHLLRVERAPSPGSWRLEIDRAEVARVAVDGRSGGLPMPLVAMAAGSDRSCDSAGVVRFSDVRVRRAGSPVWEPFPRDSVDIAYPGYRLDRRGGTSFVARPGTSGTNLWTRLFLLEAAVGLGTALLLFCLWGWSPGAGLRRGRRYPRRDLGLSLRLALALFFLAMLYTPFFALGVIFVYGATRSLPAAAVAAVAELCFALLLPAFAHVVALLRWRPRLLPADEAPELRALVERLAAFADVPTPRIAVSPAPVPEALTIGGGRRAMIVVSDALLERLDPAELEAVVAHELAHVANGDAYVVTLLSLPMNVAGFFLRPIVNLPDRFRNPFAGWTVFVGLLVVLGPLLFFAWIPWALAGLIVSAVSRYREYVADRGAALIAGPGAVMSALVTIGDELRTIPAEDLRAATPMNAFFVVPMPASRRLTLDPARLFPSHPPLDQRLARLADAAHRLGRAVEAETPRSSLRAARRPRRRNPAALISCLAGIAYTVWMFAGTPVAFDTAAASVLLYGSGLGLALALYAVGRAQAGASGFIFASVGLAAFLLPTLLAVDGALSYFVALFLHLV